MTNDPASVDRLNAIGVLTRREIELRVLAPVIDALGREFGRDRVLAVIAAVITDIARTQGRGLAASSADSSLQSFAAALEPWTRDDAMRMDGTELSETRLSCNRDAALIEGFNPSVTLTRTQTIMQGASCCDFRYAANPSLPISSSKPPAAGDPSRD
jgi:hypothetical protein